MPTDTGIDLTNIREQYSYYARRLLSDLGLGHLGQPERGQLLVAIEGYAQSVMTNTLLENLDPEKLEEAQGILDRGGDNEAVITHFLSTIPEIQEKMARSLTETYARMLTETRQLTDAINVSAKDDQSTSPDPMTSNIKDGNAQ